MKTVLGLESLASPLDRSVLTIGNFDGVHRAHQLLLTRARQYASGADAPVVVVTFDPHPLSVVAPQKTPQRLAPMNERLRRLEEAGADLVVVAKSDPALLNLEAERFVEDVIVRHFHPTHIVEGPTFGFGRGRKGNPELLRRIAGRLGFEVDIVEPITLKLETGEPVMVSSSLIRRLLTDGRVAQAREALGRAYALFGTVVEGERRGQSIGFPTVNLAVKEQLVPGDGVYAGCAKIDSATLAAAISVGCKPTFGGAGRLVEAHLLDFDGDLYGRSISLLFERRLRDQRTFESTELLVAQLHRDVEAVRRAASAIGDSSSRGDAGMCSQADRTSTP